MVEAETRLEHLVHFKTGKLNSNAAVDDGQYPFFTCSPETLRIDNYAFDCEALLLAGNNAEGVFALKYYKGKFNAYQRTYVITVRDTDKLSYGYLFYNLRTQLKELQNISHGSATKFLTLTLLNDIEIPLSPISEQKAIAEVLSSLDDKIDLLHRQNKTLESLAQTLFRQWFIEEADGQVGKLGDLVELHYGKGLREEIRTGQGFPVIGSSGTVGYHSEYLVEGPGIVIGRKGTLGKVVYVYDNFFPIDTTYFVKPKDGTERMFCEYFLLQTLNFEEMNSDSAVPGLNRDIALATEVRIPSHDRRKDFNNQCDQLFQKKRRNTEQIQSLEKLRDSLLPKLMSGEIQLDI